MTMLSRSTCAAASPAARQPPAVSTAPPRRSCRRIGVRAAAAPLPPLRAAPRPAAVAARRASPQPLPQPGRRQRPLHAASPASAPPPLLPAEPDDGSAAPDDDDAALPPLSRSRFWRWHARASSVHYVVSGPSAAASPHPPLLLLPGFGLGAPHWTALARHLADTRAVYCLEWVGSGHSWPDDHTPPFAFSADLWVDQAAAFIEQVVLPDGAIGGKSRPPIVVGNSLGGFVAAHLAARRPELLSGAALLNPAPFWGSPMGWDGVLPAPAGTALLASLWFRILSSRPVVRAVLRLVYASPAAVDDALVEAVVAPAGLGAAGGAFASILFGSPPEATFDAALAASAGAVPLLLLYGDDDPWVVPRWGVRASAARPDAARVTLSPVGHCPHHEAPGAVARLLRLWAPAVGHVGPVGPLGPPGGGGGGGTSPLGPPLDAVGATMRLPGGVVATRAA